jgi:uncharacterized membrane protein
MVFNDMIEKIGMIIDAAGVVVIVTGVAIAFVAGAVRLSRRQNAVYRRLRQQLGQAILLGLELLVAGDIVRTVAASPSLTSVAILAAIVLIRTFLSFSLEVETTGRWPWHKRDIPPLRSRTAQLVGAGPCRIRARCSANDSHSGPPAADPHAGQPGQVPGSGWLSKNRQLQPWRRAELRLEHILGPLEDLTPAPGVGVLGGDRRRPPPGGSCGVWAGQCPHLLSSWQGIPQPGQAGLAGKPPERCAPFRGDESDRAR